MPDEPDRDLVLYEVDEDGVATVSLNRPERKNAWSIPMERRFFALLDEAAADPAVRVVIVTGAGRAFCPGMDVQRLEQNAQPGQSLNLQARVPMYSRRNMPKPLIAAVNGACAGIGLVQALICDVRFAARGARFTTAFTRRGLAGEYNLPYVLPRVVGLENALDLLLSGRVFDADEAKELGLVSRVVEPEDLLGAARAYARDIARNCSPRAMAVVRHQVYGDLDRPFTDALARSYSAMEFFAGSPDFREGVASFVEKREPKFEALPPDFDPDEATRDAFLPY
ncbi:enoyl-CoA hydratase-related protein [Streptomyces pseudovenezuelae]|uniref:Enoyl-CoA hydratase/carnithine racemase n=1 Tax=Streptomyces pseudovenezuelae TaxID=67350 RepID=A0ABT6LFM8_9ACTN|nr:enoyl-CoA hydratase-related protein [Streptomyces pseudovenezuelae]MDH6214421.1 enoyl-CoA hydratase/carnithine racemase [Streptomyces pseudovenezuelae]